MKSIAILLLLSLGLYFGGFVLLKDMTKPVSKRHKYLLAEEGTFRSVKFCDIEAGILTYKEDNSKIKKLCIHCVCQRNKND